MVHTTTLMKPSLLTAKVAFVVITFCCLTFYFIATSRIACPCNQNVQNHAMKPQPCRESHAPALGRTEGVPDRRFQQKPESPQTTRKPSHIVYQAKKVGPLAVIDLEKTAHENGTFDCVIYHPPSGNTTICIHDYRKDRLISALLKFSKEREKHVQYTIYEALSLVPEAGLIDLGGNLGEMSLLAGRMGRPVVTVEPLPDNFVRLATSIRLNNFTNMTIIANGLSGKRQHFKMNVTQKGNIGTNNLAEEATPEECQKYGGCTTSVLLDDLLSVIPFSKAVLKIDIEQREWDVLKASRLFFDRLDIPFVQMEWLFVKNGNHERALLIEGFLRSKRYLPYSLEPCPFLKDDLSRHSLDNISCLKWPPNIVWVRQR